MYLIEMLATGMKYYVVINEIRSHGIEVQEVHIGGVHSRGDNFWLYQFNVIAKDDAEHNLIKLLFNDCIHNTTVIA